VGAGYWGKNLLRTFRGLSTARVSTLCDLDGPTLAAFAAEHPDLDTTTDFAALLARREVDAVVLATPPSRHHAMALAALEAGKHVWVEKPLALTAAHGRELVAAAARRGTTLFVDETFLYDPLVVEMRQRIEAGELGDVYHLSFERLGMGRIRRDSDVWWNSAPHDLSILFYLVPRDPRRVQLHLHSYLQRDLADQAVADLELEGGVSAHVYLSWLHPQKVASVFVIGSKRMLQYEGRFEKRALTLHDYTVDLSPLPGGRSDGPIPIVPISNQRATEIPAPAGIEPLREAAAHFVDCVLSGREPRSSGAKSLRVVEALDMAVRGATRGGFHA
jgi:predicted dehydrogenase